MTGALLILVSAQIAVRGTVAGAESHQPLSFSTVALHPGFEQRFTDAGGGFVFPGVRPGNYLLSVRQIGYAPLDTQRQLTTLEVKGKRQSLTRIAGSVPAAT